MGSAHQLIRKRLKCFLGNKGWCLGPDGNSNIYDSNRVEMAEEMSPSLKAIKHSFRIRSEWLIVMKNRMIMD